MSNTETNLSLEKIEAHLRVLEAGFVALARLHSQGPRNHLVGEFERNVDAIAASFAKLGRTDEWRSSLYTHRDVLKELIG